MSNPEKGFLVAEAGLDKTGPQILDEIVPSLVAINPAGFGIISGSIRLQQLANIGVDSGGIERYVAGRDMGFQIDIPSSFAGEGLMTRLPSPDVDIAKIHILADLPERLVNTTGRATLAMAARYAVCTALAAANRAQAPATLTLISREGVSRVFDGGGTQMLQGVRAVDDVLQGNSPKVLGLRNDETILSAGIETVTNRLANPHEDVMLVISDFLAGYDKEQGEFEWEDAISKASMMFGDRLLVARLKSPAHEIMPITAASALGHFEIAKARRDFASLAAQKSADIARALQHTRVGVIDSGSKDPIKYQVKSLITSSKSKA